MALFFRGLKKVIYFLVCYHEESHIQNSDGEGKRKATHEERPRNSLKYEEHEGKRKPIPKHLRDEVWIKYNGYTEMGYCYCCGFMVQRYHAGWHCAHVVAVEEGGTTTIDNLRVCCPGCNLSMGNQNLYAYIRDKNLNGPGKSGVQQYLSRHQSQVMSKRTSRTKK